MFLPTLWLRRRKLQSALLDYPLYDPPHKGEERLLSKKQVADNFGYFMHVREQRLAYFCAWLRRDFEMFITPDEMGVRALNLWSNKYAGLLVMGPDGRATKSYFTYDPPWIGENAGANVLFDIGITVGEFIIANCPKLYWNPDPISPILPRKARRLQLIPGAGFQRPMITGFEDPVSRKAPLHTVYGFACQMLWATTTLGGLYARYWSAPSIFRGMRDTMLEGFKATLKEYPDGDPYKLREQVAPENYLTFMDQEDEDVDEEEELIYAW